MLSPKPRNTRLGLLMPSVLANHVLMLLPKPMMALLAAPNFALIPLTKPSISMPPKSVNLAGRSMPIQANTGRIAL